MNELVQAVAGAAREMSWAEVVAVVTGVACVLLTVRQNVWCWPVGMVSSGLFIWVFAQARLYPDALLQICFILISVYGWYRWARGVQQADLPVSRLGLPACLMFVTLGLAFTAGIGWFFASALPQLWPEIPPAALPYVDSGILAFSLIAQAGLSRKILQTWLVWISIDVVAIGVYWSRELYLTSLLYVIFLGLAIAGYLAWRRAWRKAVTR